MKKLIEILQQIFAEHVTTLKVERFRYKNGDLGVLAIIRIVEKHSNYTVSLQCFDGDEVLSYQEALKNIFDTAPLPNKLKVPKKRYLAGDLDFGAIYNIITKHSDYTVDFILLKKI